MTVIRSTPSRQPDPLLEAIESQIVASLNRSEAQLLRLEARLATARGEHRRAWWLHTRADALDGAA